jgi:hypothetical protein
MALSSAQKQRRYRERHLGKDGEKVRLQAFISFQTEARLQRLARHHGYSITALIEKIADDADNAVLAGLPEDAVRDYLEGPQPGA